MTSLSKTQVKKANKMILTYKAPKKRGRPVGSKNKKKPAAKPTTFKRIESHAAEINKLHNRILELEKMRDALHNLVNSLEHQGIQYRAVISYLETKLELE